MRSLLVLSCFAFLVTASSAMAQQIAGSITVNDLRARIERLEAGALQSRGLGGAQPLPADVINRLSRLEAELDALSRTRTIAAPVSGAGVPEALVRLDSLESELRSLTGQVEEIQFGMQRRIDAAEKRLADLDSRMAMMEDSALAPVPAPAPVQLAPPAIIDTTPTAPQVPIGPAQPLPLQPSVSVPTTIDPRTEYDLAMRLMESGAIDDARPRLEAVIAAAPRDPLAGAARYWLGETQYARGDYPGAARSFLEAFRDWPDGIKAPDSLLRLGVTLAVLGKIGEACETFAALPRRYPGAAPDILTRASVERQRYQCSP